MTRQALLFTLILLIPAFSTWTASASGPAPNVEPYIDALDCVQANGTDACNNQNTSQWPHDATIKRRDSNNGTTEATIKLRIEGKGDPIKTTRPQQTILVMDDSGSMTWNDPNGLRFNASKHYADLLQVPDEIGFVIYGEFTGNNSYSELRSPLTMDYSRAKQGMYGNSSGSTPTIYGLEKANDELVPKKKPGFYWSIIHLTDGCWGPGGDPQPQVDRMVNEQIQLYDIGLYPDPNSTDKLFCEPYLIKWSQQTMGKYYWAQNAQDLNQIYEQILHDEVGFDTQTAGTPPNGEPMLKVRLTNDIEVVPGSFRGSAHSRPTRPANIGPNNRGLLLEWQTPVYELKIKQFWEVMFDVRSYRAGDSVNVIDVSESRVAYDRYDGSHGGRDPFERLTLKVLLPDPVLPSAPQNLKGIIDGRNVRLNWSPPQSDGYTEILSYKIYRGTGPGEERAFASTDGPATEYTDLDVTDGYKFYYRVSAVNMVGEGNLSDETSVPVIVKPSPPGIPLGIGTYISGESIVITWQAPTDDGNSRITGYKIYRSVVSGERELYQQVGAWDLTFVDGNGREKTTFYYRVSAINKAGEGELSEEASAVMPERDSSWQAPKGSIQVCVKDASTREPLHYAKVWVDSDRSSPATDYWGHIKVSNVSIGRHTLTVSVTGYITMKTSVTVDEPGVEVYFYLMKKVEGGQGDRQASMPFDPQPMILLALCILVIEITAFIIVFKRSKRKGVQWPDPTSFQLEMRPEKPVYESGYQMANRFKNERRDARLGGEKNE